MKNTKNLLAAITLAGVLMIGASTAKAEDNSHGGIIVTDFMSAIYNGITGLFVNDAPTAGIIVTDRSGIIVTDRSGIIVTD